MLNSANSDSINRSDGMHQTGENHDTKQSVEKDAVGFQLTTEYNLPVVTQTHRTFNSRALPLHAETYELEKFDKNYLLIFNHRNIDGHVNLRHGTEKDVEQLCETFGELGFVTQVQNDLTKNEIMDKLKELSTTDFTEYGCVIVTVLTHGDRKGFIYAKDMRYNENDILNYLHARRNPTLLTKPRIVLIQACRGEKFLRGVTVGRPVEVEKDIGEEYYTLPNESDILLFHNSYTGKASHRDQVYGSWFIQTLCVKIKTLASDMDLESIFKEVKRDVAIDRDMSDTTDVNKQLPVTISTLTRKLYLKSSGEAQLDLAKRPEQKIGLNNLLITASSGQNIPPIQYGPCCCFLEHFDYTRECIRSFVAQSPNDVIAKFLLDVADSVADTNCNRNLKCKLAKNICSHLKENGKDEIYFYVYKEESGCCRHRII